MAQLAFTFFTIVLLGILPQPYYSSWMKFTCVMHIFLADSVPFDLLKSAQKHVFFLFLNEYEALYGKEKVTFKPILSCISLTVLGSGIFC